MANDSKLGGMSESEPIVRRKLADEVKDRLRAMIRGGEIQPGDRLPSERDLMGRFSVGRPAIREALQSLGAAGLIEINHGERARVIVPNTRDMFSRLGETMSHLLQTSPATLEDLKEARILFEVGMIRIAAQAAKPADIQNLEIALERQRQAIHDVPEFVRCDMAFHTAIASIGGNRVITLLSEAMLDWLFEYRRDLLRLPGSELITLAEHERLVSAVAAHEADAAERAMSEHLNRSNERYRILEAAMLKSAKPGRAI